MILESNTLFDFSNEVVPGMDIYTEYLGESLVLKQVQIYEGPVTLQYLPYGGIQSVFNGKLIINTKSGFIIPTFIVYQNKEYSNEEFTTKYTDLVNQVLPC